MWLNLAWRTDADQEDLDRRDAVADQMTPEQIAEAQRLAGEWKPKTWEELKERGSGK